MPARSLGHKNVLLTATTWGGAALGMLVSILVGRVLGPAALGSLGFSTGVVGLVMAALLPGFAQAHLKRLAEGQDAGRCVGTMLAIQLALHAVLVAAVLVLWSVQGIFTRSDLALVFLGLLGAQVATNFADIFLKVMVAREWVVPARDHPAGRAPAPPARHRGGADRGAEPGRGRPHLRGGAGGERARRRPRARPPLPRGAAGADPREPRRLLELRAAVPGDHAARPLPGLHRPGGGRSLGRASPRPATTRSPARCGRRCPG